MRKFCGKRCLIIKFFVLEFVCRKCVADLKSKIPKLVSYLRVVFEQDLHCDDPLRALSSDKEYLNPQVNFGLTFTEPNKSRIGPPSPQAQSGDSGNRLPASRIILEVFRLEPAYRQDGEANAGDNSTNVQQHKGESI